MADEQLSFFHPTSTVTGQTGWPKDEAEARLQSIRDKHHELAKQRFNAIWHDRRNDLD